MANREETLRARARQYGQEQIFQFWDRLDGPSRERLLDDIEAIDFALMQRLIDTWIKNEPPPETFDRIDPVEAIPIVDPARPDAREALAAGEAALRGGRVGIVLVAGGQGTRLGFDGPKGAYPVGPLTGHTLFQYHAEKIRNLQDTYGRALPWYIMVSAANAADTAEFFEANAHFGLNREDIHFFQQAMVPCVSDDGKFLLEAPDRVAKNPNGHGGSIAAMVDSGIIADARKRGIDTLSYFQVDNWAVNMADPYFIGYHCLRNGRMSSKVHRKRAPREAVGVHCLCDGVYHVIEYSELDLYPQLLETGPDGNVIHYAGNPAIHVLDVGFIEELYADFAHFPWHRAHKKTPHLDDSGALVEPDRPNAYKFETFIFDALRFTGHPPIALEISNIGEYTPIKQFDGDNSVVAARRCQNILWAEWIEAAGGSVPRGADGAPAIDIEISPLFARTKVQFIARSAGKDCRLTRGAYIDPSGETRLEAEVPAD